METFMNFLSALAVAAVILILAYVISKFNNDLEELKNLLKNLNEQETMINEHEILDALTDIRNKTKLLANPLYNDSGESKFWADIDKKLEEAEKALHNEIGIEKC